MSLSPVTLRIEGPSAARIADELAAAVEAELGQRPQRVEPAKPGSASEEVERTDPWTAAAVFLALPPAIVSVMDLVQRARLKEKLDRLIAWTKAKLQTDPQHRITVHTDQGRSIRLDTAQAADVLELVMEATVQAQASTKGKP